MINAAEYEIIEILNIGIYIWVFLFIMIIFYMMWIIISYRLTKMKNYLIEKNLYKDYLQQNKNKRIKKIQEQELQ